MWIRLHAPFGDGKTWEEIEFQSPVGVDALITRLVAAHPQLRPYLRSTPEETFHHFILIRGDYVLRSGDKIDPEDRIVVMMPLAGG